MSGYVQSNQVVSIPSVAAYAVSISDTGKIMMLPQTVAGVAIAITLPAVAPGLHYRFINGSPLIAAAAITIAAAGAIIHGQIIQGPTNGVSYTPAAGLTTLSLAIGVVGPPATGSIKGDYADFYSDGVLWYLQAASSRILSMTIA